ncbi:MAG TPA: VOC family protein [Mycobacteriales bacterium]|nr:VOC family protein [Mycobacteriales bacterium]
MNEPVGRWVFVQVDALDPVAQAEFWAAVLGTSIRGSIGDPPQYVGVNGTSPEATRLAFQRVPELVPGKNRLHLDIHVDDLEAATARVEALGATRAPEGDVAEHGIRWRVMHDPEGNVFCLVPD